jgi:hypothetical protein
MSTRQHYSRVPELASGSRLREGGRTGPTCFLIEALSIASNRGPWKGSHGRSQRSRGGAGWWNRFYSVLTARPFIRK